MKCPVCQNQLASVEVSGLHVDLCRDGCSGMWFDAAELERFDEHHEPFPESLLRVNKSPNVLIDRSKPRSCPRCEKMQLARIVLDPETRFELDRCPGCSGHWLDNGELGRMRKESKEGAAIEQRLAAFDRRVTEQLRDPVAAKRVAAFLRVIFR